MLKGKHIILGITGGIAAYKSVYLLRLLVKRGAEVQVVITPSGKEFITPVTLSALSGRPVISEFFTANTGQWNSHVDIGLWADAMVIAPATASTLAKMANGVADNMLVTTYLSAKAPVFAAPAMDLDMMAHPTTTRNIEQLIKDGCHIIEPGTGELASHLTGKGRMAEPEEIVDYLEDYFSKSKSLSGKKIMITAGPTVEKIDPVRYISNFSTGKMGYSLAEEAAERGAEVTIISGPVNITTNNKNIRVIKVESAKEMLAACEEHFPMSDIGIMCAAVADYAPKIQSMNKIKRDSSEERVIELVKNPDIAATLGKSKKNGQVLIGFALETDKELENARAKLLKKNLDIIVLNSLNKPDSCFGTDRNTVTIITKNGKEADYPSMLKKEVASDILDSIETLCKELKY